MTDEKEKLAALKILVVDDSAVQREHVIGLCQFYGVNQISTAKNGEAAIALLEQESFDLAFIDLEMPVMDGVTLVRQIAARKLIQSIVILSSKDPILILSIGTMAENDGLNVLGTFKKPLQTPYLHSILKNLLADKSQYKSSRPVFNVSPEEVVEAMNQDQLIVHFQPKLKSDSLVLNGVEALIRWNHPQHGLVGPDKFIPIAERFGFIDDLTYKIFHLALAQIQIWQRKGASFAISLNLSPLSLNDSQFADNIINLVKQYAVKPEDVVLEITENAISEQISQAIELLAKLRLQGFQISIDDFGIGYASLMQLSRVPANELKIDGSLVNNIAHRPQQQAILNNILNMANDLGLKTVVEGVETEDDFHFLRARKIDLMQGYLLGRPLPATDFEHWWHNQLNPMRKQLLSEV